MFLQREPHVLLHLLHAVVVRVDEVKGQRASQWTTASAWGHAEKPATRTQKKKERESWGWAQENERGRKIRWLDSARAAQLPCIINWNKNNPIFTKDEESSGGGDREGGGEGGGEGRWGVSGRAKCSKKLQALWDHCTGTIFAGVWLISSSPRSHHVSSVWKFWIKKSFASVLYFRPYKAQLGSVTRSQSISSKFSLFHCCHLVNMEILL